MKAKEIKIGYPIYHIEDSDVYFEKGTYVSDIVVCANGNIIFYLNDLAKNNWIQTYTNKNVYFSYEELDFKNKNNREYMHINQSK